MPGDFNGKWVTCKAEGWEGFLKKFNIPTDKIPADIVVTEEITQSGDKITIKSSSNKDDKVKEVIINVGSNHKDAVAGGKELEFTTAWDGAKLVMKNVDGKGGGVIREITGGQMLLTLDAGDGVIAKSYYNKA
ncbi:fatty acid-binding protein 2, liver-like [Patiria miniata]|uniref:Uncharacterized protein n=1 Tax=Patiria miniata TaxID=46514 RepID=A0A914BFX3_PATMI|nr:fatty acid-binding protein 2, liver-like [Patiria miniata]